MPPSLAPQDFLAKWRHTALTERAASQSHFIDICRLLGHPTPADLDPAGEFFTFEAGASKQEGGQGWADVWYKGRFAWEYKGKHANLDKAYQQLLQYRESLQNPPLLIVSDIDQILIHTNFTNTAKRVYTLTLDDLLQSDRLSLLRAAFYEPESLKSPLTTHKVTEEAAAQFARLAELLRAYGGDNQQIAHFLIRLLFCLFAEDVGLLPNNIFSRLVITTRTRPPAFHAQLRQLFAAMSTGGWFGSDEIPHIDGRLFDDDQVLTFDSDSLDVLARVCELDWSSIEPSIFGTLFERGLDPSKRSQLGAHYTSKEDILLIVEPVLMAPFRRKWEEIQAKARELAEKSKQTKVKGQRTRLKDQLTSLLTGFAAELSKVQILDPACGSGNFLYVALRQLLDLEKAVINLAVDLDVGRFFPSVNPSQLHGIEINSYAHQLAQTTIWIGYIQWLQENGYGFPSQPILKPLDNILQMDAILAYDQQGQPVEPEWPKADVIIGNPPFLGGNKVRQELGDRYIEAIFSLYKDRVPGFADLVCYWFEKAWKMLEQGKTKRVGLLATQGIRGGANRKVLDHIKEQGDIFWAQSDRDWILEGATVHVSMVGFDNGSETLRFLDGKAVSKIGSDLRAGIDLTKAQRLAENSGIAFIGDTKKGKFDIPNSLAREMLSAPLNPNGKPNREVIRPWINGLDITQRPRSMWIIDFDIEMTELEASQYEVPFEYIRIKVKPAREKVRNQLEKKRWWIHGRPASDFRQATKSLRQYIATPRVAKHRLFVFVDTKTVPDGQVVAFARDSEYFLGVLHSKPHELWSRNTGTQLRDAESGFRYSQTYTFETFPFPWPPSREPSEADDPRVYAIAQAARELVEKRDAWLNPPGVSEAELNKRTLTNLYNQRPTWLDLAHRKLDQAVFDAYGWPHDLTDEQILERLLALNLERAKNQSNREALP